MELAPILFLLVSVVAIAILRHLLKSKLEQEYITEETETEIAHIRSKISNFNTIKEVSLQILMYIGLFNLINFVSCSVLYFTFNPNKKVQTINYIFLGLGISIYILTLLLFKFDPDPFDYFRYSFKRDRKSMAYFYIYGFVIVSGVVLLCVLPDMSFPPMIPFAIMLLYVIAIRPYK